MSLSESFLDEYEKHAPVSRQRVALWETLDIFMLVLHGWIKSEGRRVIRYSLSARAVFAGEEIRWTTMISDLMAGLSWLMSLPDWLLAPLQSRRFHGRATLAGHRACLRRMVNSILWDKTLSVEGRQWLLGRNVPFRCQIFIDWPRTDDPAAR